MPSSSADLVVRSSRLARLLRWEALPHAVGGALFVAVMLWTLLVAPRYRSEALLRVQAEPEAGLGNALSALPGASALGLGNGDEVETEMGVIRSRRMLDAAIDSLALTVRLTTPDGVRGDWAEVALRDRTEAEGTLRFAATARGRWRVTFDLEDGARDAVEVASGDTLRVGGVWVRVAPADSLAERGFTLSLHRRADVREALEDRLDVRRPEIGSRLVALRFDDEDRVLAAGVLRVMIGEYLAFRAREDRGDLGTTAAELRRQIAVQARALAAAEDAERRYQESSGLVVPDEQAAQQVRRYAGLRAELDGLENERAALGQVIALVQQRAAGAARPGDAYRQLATYPALFGNKAVQDLLNTLVALENELSSLRLRRTDENRDTRQLLARIAELEQSLLSTATQYMESVGQRARTVGAAMSGIDAEVRVLPERTLRLIRLGRERQLLSDAYLLLQRQLRQTELRDALRLDQVRVVDAPQVSAAEDPQFPKPLVHLVLALVLALSSGLATAAVRRVLTAA